MRASMSKTAWLFFGSVLGILRQLVHGHLSICSGVSVVSLPSAGSQIRVPGTVEAWTD